MTLSLRTGAILVLVPLTACRVIPTADAVLSEGPLAAPVEEQADAAPVDPGRTVVADAGTRAREALELARAEDTSPTAWIAAARALVTAADVRIQAAIAHRFDSHVPPGPEALIDAEGALPSDVRSEVAGLCREARAAARRALEKQPEDLEARLIEALADALGAWADGPSRALLGGAAGRLPAKLKELANDAPALEGAAPLRLRGRFLRRAPWPTRDRPTGRTLLVRAAELSPSPLNLMFLGDAQWVDGDSDLALVSWEHATNAVADPLTAPAAPLVQKLATWRIQAARR